MYPPKDGVFSGHLEADCSRSGVPLLFRQKTYQFPSGLSARPQLPDRTKTTLFFLLAFSNRPSGASVGLDSADPARYPLVTSRVSELLEQMQEHPEARCEVAWFK